MAIIVGGLLEKDGKFLLVQEAKEKCYGKWNLPAGRLDNNETIFEGAEREIYEETGCKASLTGIIDIANRKIENDIFLGIIFSTKIVEEKISFDKNEILDVKWFSYKEILNMKNELRSYDLITITIKNFIEKKVIPLDFIRMIQ